MNAIETIKQRIAQERTKIKNNPLFNNESKGPVR